MKAVAEITFTRYGSKWKVVKAKTCKCLWSQ